MCRVGSLRRQGTKSQHMRNGENRQPIILLNHRGTLQHVQQENGLNSDIQSDMASEETTLIPEHRPTKLDYVTQGETMCDEEESPDNCCHRSQGKNCDDLTKLMKAPEQELSIKAQNKPESSLITLNPCCPQECHSIRRTHSDYTTCSTIKAEVSIKGSLSFSNDTSDLAFL